MKLKELILKPLPFQQIYIPKGSIIHNVLVKDPVKIYLLIEENYTYEKIELGVMIININDSREIPDNYIYINSFQLNTYNEKYTFHVFVEDILYDYDYYKEDTKEIPDIGINDILNHLN